MSKQTFDFSEALKRMRQGKKVRRKAIKDIEYVTLTNNNFYAKKYKYEKDLTFITLSKSYILATDWEEVEE